MARNKLNVIIYSHLYLCLYGADYAKAQNDIMCKCYYIVQCLLNYVYLKEIAIIPII